MKQDYYVYVFLDPSKEGNFEYADISFKYEPFYIGKGVNDRIKSTKVIGRCSGFKKSKLISLKNKGIKPIVEILFENLSNEKSLEIEKLLISKIGRRDLKLGPLTNLTDGGDGRTNGRNSLESNEKGRISKIKTNQRKREMGYDFSLTEDTKEKLRKINQGKNNPMYGKTHTEEVKESHSLRVSGINHPMFGKIHNEETIEKIKESRSKSVNQEELNIKSSEFNSKSILQYSLDGILITEFKSIKEASQKTGLSESLIGKTCRGIVKNPRKFIFKFRNNEDKVLRNSFLIKIGEYFDNYKLIKRNKKSVIVEKDGIILTLRLKEYPIFWEKRSIPV